MPKLNYKGVPYVDSLYVNSQTVITGTGLCWIIVTNTGDTAKELNISDGEELILKLMIPPYDSRSFHFEPSILMETSINISKIQNPLTALVGYI